MSARVVVVLVAIVALAAAAGALVSRVASTPAATSSGSAEVFAPPTSPSGASSTTGSAASPYKAYGEGLRPGQVVQIRRGDMVLTGASVDAQGRWSIDLQPDLFTNGERLSLWLDGIDTGRRFEPLGGQAAAPPGLALAGSATTGATSTALPSGARAADDLPPDCGVSDLPYKAYGSGIRAKQRVEAFFNGTRVGQAIADDSGNWSFNVEPKPPLVAGARMTFNVDGAEIAGVVVRFCSAQFPRPPGIVLGGR